MPILLIFLFPVVVVFIVLVLAFFLPPVAVILGFKGAKKLRSRQPSTRALERRVQDVGEPFPDRETFQDRFSEYLLSAWTKTPRPEIMDALMQAAGTLYAGHTFVPLAPNKPETDDAILRARYKDQLIRGIETARDARYIVAAITTAFTEAFTEILRKLPSACFQDATPLFTVALTDMVRDPGQTVADVIKPFQSIEIQQRRLFAELREQLNRNLYEASGAKSPAPEYKLVHPWEFKGSARDIVKAYLGYTPLQYIFDVRVPLPITAERMLEHWMICAGSGHGKSQTLQHIIHHHITSPDPPTLVVIDSQGDLIWKVQNLKVFADDPDRLILIDPQYDPALNIFQMGSDRLAGYAPIVREQLEAGINELYSYIFSALQSDMTSKQGTAFLMVLKLVMAVPDVSLHTLLQLMEDQAKSFRESPFYEYADALDEVTHSFFENQFFNRQAFGQTKQQLARRLYAILSVPAFNRSFAARANELDMFQELQAGGKVILIHTSKALLKQDASALFGRYAIGLVLGAVFERVIVPESERRPAYLIIDEAADILDENMESLLTQARKYRLGCLFAFQHLAQLSPSLRATIAANTAIKFAGGTSDADNRALDSDLRTTPQFIASMKKGDRSTEFAAFIRNELTSAVRVSVPFGTLESAPRMTREEHAAFIERNRARYSDHFQPAPDKVETPAPAPADDDYLAPIPKDS